MRQSFRVPIIIPLIMFLSGSFFCALAQEYTILPQPPDLKRDAATNFLLDLSRPKSAADFAAGESRLDLAVERFGEDGCYRGSINIPMERNFNPAEWTIEMVVRLPADEAAKGNDVTLGRWESGATNLVLTLSRGVGATYRMFGRHGADGRKYEFNFGAAAGGGGATIHRDAPGRWIYVAFAFDMENRCGDAIVRDMDGGVLLRSMQYAGAGSLNDGFLQNIPEAERAAAIDQAWRDMAESLRRLDTAMLTIGSDGVDIRALRISGEYRREIAQPQPVVKLEGIKIWRGGEIDPARAASMTFMRSIGYPGERSRRNMEIEEHFVSVKPGSEPVKLNLGELPIGLYSLYIHGTVDPAGREELARVWKPCPMEFEARDAAGQRVGWGRLLLKQSFTPRLMQGFHFQVNEPGEYTATLSIPASAMETPRIREIVLVDALEGLPDEVVKIEQRLVMGRGNHPAALTQARMERDDRIWNAFIPLNTHTYTGIRNFDMHSQNFAIPRWTFKDEGRGIDSIFTNFDIVNRDTGEEISGDRALMGEPLPGEPTDDGTGIFFSKDDHPELPHDIYAAPRARLMLQRGMRFWGAPIDEGSGNTGERKLARAYMETGNIDAGHDAAMALVRIAYDFPALDYGLQDIRLCTHNPDLEYNQNWSYGRGGKLINWSWSADDVRGMMIAYDQLFPYIKDNQVFADAVNRFIPWIKTPDDVIKMIDRRLIFAAVRDVDNGRLANNRRIHDMAGEIMGPHITTVQLFDFTRQFAAIHPYQGTFQELYGSALSRLGHYHIGSTGYALGHAASIVRKALTTRRAREAGLALIMDLSDVESYPKIRGAADFVLDVWVAGGFGLALGDASFGTHAGRIGKGRVAGFREVSEIAVDLWRDPRHAWLLVNLHNVNDPRTVEAAKGARDPIMHSVSRVLEGWAGILELNPDSEDPREKTAALMMINNGQGHAHNDFLDLNIYAMGLPMAVDLGQRNEGGHWTRPHAAWSFLHNHAIAHDTDNPAGAGNQEGEPWLRAFNPPLMRGSYVNRAGDVRLERDVFMMQVGDSQIYYAFDLQRLWGSVTHTWCFHGVESDDVQLNVPMREEVVRWTDRMLPEKGDKDLPLSQRIGTAAENLQAVWTATREAREYEHNFMGGVPIRTVALEPSVQGELYDPALPPARIRAILLGHGGATVMSAKAFSQPYAYAFPFLWVQHPAGDGPSIYPAVYDWYRGDEPVVAEAKLLQRDPIVVEVTTTAGQVDTYRLEGRVFSAVSRDGDGVRWAQLSCGQRLEADGLIIATEDRQVGYAASIESIDYAESKFITANPLPPLTGAMIVNPGRRTWVNFDGRGRNFIWRYDLLAHEGRITNLNVVDDNHIELQTNQNLFHAGIGNRKPEGFVLTNEDRSWHFRHTGAGNRYRVIHRPEGAALATDVFTDANGDGFIHARTYEIGIGDNVEVPANIIVRRTEDGYRVETNVPCVITLGGAPVMRVRLAPGSHDIKR